jgi:hypothetical protein
MSRTTIDASLAALVGHPLLLIATPRRKELS